MTVAGVIAPSTRYHDGTKHHFHRFARSLGYLDWASQPNPFRSFAGAPRPACSRAGVRADYAPRRSLRRLCRSRDRRNPLIGGRSAICFATRSGCRRGSSSARRAGRCASTRRAAISIRPRRTSSVGAIGRARAMRAGVYHYAPDRHALERRCAFDAARMARRLRRPADVLLVALTSIHWREAWKYGERAFRYCQHDLGHAIARRRASPRRSSAGARALLPDVVARDDRGARPASIATRTSSRPSAKSRAASSRSTAARRRRRCRARRARARRRPSRRGRWTGRASQLSEDHVAVDVHRRDRARRPRIPGARSRAGPTAPVPDPDHPIARDPPDRVDARALDPAAPQRRRLRRPFVDRRARRSSRCSRASCPADARRGTRCGGRRAFTSRCSSIASTASRRACTCCARDAGGARAAAAPRAAASSSGSRSTTRCRSCCLARGDCRALAARLSCDQDIAADGFFSLGMIADFDASLAGVRPVVLSASVLGVGRGRAGAVSRSRSRRRARHRHRLLLRRSRARRPRPDGPRVPEPVSLHGRHAGRGHAADDGAGYAWESVDHRSRMRNVELTCRTSALAKFSRQSEQSCVLSASRSRATIPRCRRALKPNCPAIARASVE